MNESNLSTSQGSDQSLSFTKLTAMIIGSTIGGGIFTTAGDMAALGAHTGLSAGQSAAWACSV